MSEAYTYGGNGSLERIEYNALNERELIVCIERVNEEIEFIFEKAHPSPGIVNYFSQDEEGMYRHLESTSTPASDSYLLFDTEGTTLVKVQPVFAVNSVKLEYGLHLNDILREEYVLKVEQNEPGTKGSFSTRYHFRHYATGHWQASVEHVDIENDDYHEDRPQNNSKYYSRDMTSYDFNEFFKDTAQIKDQLGIVLVQ